QNLFSTVGRQEHLMIAINFFREIVSDFSEPIKVLIVCFATEKDTWPDQFEWEKKKFTFLNENIEFILADDNPEIFPKQVVDSDAIYIKGGSTQPLYKKLKNIKNLSNLFRGKILAGSSAGANIVAKYYYSYHRDRIEEGLGILPIKVFVHYSEEKVEKLKILEKHKENLKTYVIPETEYVVIDKINLKV
ncbi:MAG TPA: hypothetical protein ENG89_01060, partial [Candidatus Moranbacteria bacterium]|nr:hypothetical protein [Candidatus Moranbacteria bacterium]